MLATFRMDRFAETFLSLMPPGVFSLTPGVFSTRIPPWILPQVDPDTLDSLRPDMLIIQGLSHSKFTSIRSHLESPDPSISRPTLRTLQRSCTIHIIELGYTSDRSHFSYVTRKRQQHNLLAYFLRDAGWSLPSCPAPITFPSHVIASSSPHLTSADLSTQADASPLPPQFLKTYLICPCHSHQPFTSPSPPP